MIDITNYLNLMKKIAGKYYWKYSKFEYDDLYQSACLGLVKARNVYDESKGIEFSTLAYKCATNEILRLYESEKREKRKENPYSLEYEYENGNGITTLRECLEDRENGEFWEENLIEQLELKEAISKLRENEKEILLMIYFFELNCGQISRLKGYSSSNANRIKKNAIRKLRLELGVTGKVEVKKRFSKKGRINYGKYKEA